MGNLRKLIDKGKGVRITHIHRTGLDQIAVPTSIRFHALASNGVIERVQGGKYRFPYDAVKVAFELRAAA
ncbi:MAG: hypothetical protein QM741_09390 [Rudaea sp.]|uniref:hypothetical protein n=1 Tax=Rudaea sp. TaxID=2136325 RepID=UPI0039E657F0